MRSLVYIKYIIKITSQNSNLNLLLIWIMCLKVNGITKVY